MTVLTFFLVCLAVGCGAAGLVVLALVIVGGRSERAVPPKPEPASFRQAAREQAMGDNEWDLFEASDTHSEDDWDRKYEELRSKYPLWRLWR